MKKIKLLIELIKVSTKAKIITGAICLGVLTSGSIVTYAMLNNNTNNENVVSSGSEEISTSYSNDEEADNEEVINEEDTKDTDKKESTVDTPASEPATTSDNTSVDKSTSSKETPSTPSKDTSSTPSTPSAPQNSSTSTTPTPAAPKYKAAGIDWDLTSQANQLKVSIYGTDYDGARVNDIQAIAKDVCLNGSAIPQWLITGIKDNVYGDVKYIETRIGKYTISDVSNLRTAVVQSYNQTLSTDLEGNSGYMKVVNDGSGNMTVYYYSLVLGLR